MLEKIASFILPDALAMAPAPSGDGQGGGAAGFLSGILPLVIIFVIFYFLLIRPQQKERKAHQKLIDELKKGDKVVTSSGIYGLVEQVSDKTVVIKIAENVKVKFAKPHVAAVRSSADED